MEKCFFCSVQGKKIAENRDFFSMYDDFPASRGHALVIPKAHLVSFLELSSGQVQEMCKLIKETVKVLQGRFKPDGFNIGINEGRAAGRTQDHLHVHIIPRYKGDVENPAGGVRNLF